MTPETGPERRTSPCRKIRRFFRRAWWGVEETGTGVLKSLEDTRFQIGGRVLEIEKDWQLRRMEKRKMGKTATICQAEQKATQFLFQFPGLFQQAQKMEEALPVSAEEKGKQLVEGARFGGAKAGEVTWQTTQAIWEWGFAAGRFFKKAAEKGIEWLAKKLSELREKRNERTIFP